MFKGQVQFLFPLNNSLSANLHSNESNESLVKDKKKKLKQQLKVVYWISELGVLTHTFLKSEAKGSWEYFCKVHWQPGGSIYWCKMLVIILEPSLWEIDFAKV